MERASLEKKKLLSSIFEIAAFWTFEFILHKK